MSCRYMVECELARRPANALNVEIGQPLARCQLKTPKHWGDRDPLATRWLLSGGSPLVLGVCLGSEGCPNFSSNNRGRQA